MIHMEHIALYVSDMQRARAFFVTYFGATAGTKYHNRNTNFQSYFLTFDGGSRLEIMTRPNLAQTQTEMPRLGFAHIAFSVGSKEAVDTLTQRLQQDGYAVLSGPRTTGDGYYESCIGGTEGYQIEITV